MVVPERHHALEVVELLEEAGNPRLGEAQGSHGPRMDRVAPLGVLTNLVHAQSECWTLRRHPWPALRQASSQTTCKDGSDAKDDL